MITSKRFLTGIRRTGHRLDFTSTTQNWKISPPRHLAGRIQQLKDLRTQFDRIPHASLSVDEQIDAEVLQGQINAELLDLETLQMWRKNPMTYVGVPGNSIDSLIKRDFAPAKERLSSVIARLKAVPSMLEAMRQNIDNPPHEFTDLAVRVARGSAGFFKDGVAVWAKDAAGTDSALHAEFAKGKR